MDGTKYVFFNFLPVSMGSLYNTKFLNILRDSLLVLAEYVLLYSDSTSTNSSLYLIPDFAISGIDFPDPARVLEEESRS